MLKNYDDPRHRPITAAQVRQELAEQKRREQEERQRPVREAETKLIETHRKLHSLEKGEVVAGRKDPGWVLPPSADGLNMSMEQAQEFNRKSSEQFVAEHPEYYPTRKNADSLQDYLAAQKIGIVTPECWAQAFERLSAFGLLEERPQSVEAPPSVEEPESEPVELKPDEKLTPGFDLITGAPKMWSEKELWHLSSADLKRAFKMWVSPDGTDRRPTISRSIA